MPPTDLDPATLRRACDGDREALRALIVRHQDLVWATAARVLGPRSPDLPDVAQDAMLKVLHALPGFDPQGPARLSTWIATITLRTALDVARRRRVVVPLDALADARADAPLADEVLDDADARACLARAVSALAPEQRAAMELRVEHELSYDQIAAALRVDVGTVKSRLARATAALRAALAATLTPESRHG
ncbi:MAG: sigma-70 family RNA polymerase sigma factor [Polyangiales bacterium]